MVAVDCRATVPLGDRGLPKKYKEKGRDPFESLPFLKLKRRNYFFFLAGAFFAGFLAAAFFLAAMENHPLFKLRIKRKILQK